MTFGTLTSRAQYLVDVREWGFEDARLAPHGTLTEEEVKHWTEAIKVAPSELQRVERPRSSNAA